jgi:hypothetical protein
LHVYTRAQDEEVRVVAVVDDAGDTYHVTITPTDRAVVVEAALSQRADRRTPSRERREFVFRQVAPFPELGSALETAWDRICRWIAQAGHTRTTACHDHLTNQSS